MVGSLRGEKLSASLWQLVERLQLAARCSTAGRAPGSWKQAPGLCGARPPGRHWALCSAHAAKSTGALTAPPSTLQANSQEVPQMKVASFKVLCALEVNWGGSA